MPRVAIVHRCAWTMSTFRDNWIRELVSKGWEVHAIGRGGDGCESIVEEAGAPFHDVPLNVRSNSPRDDLRYQSALLDLFRKLKPDVVHLHTIKPVIYGAHAARKARVPRVISSLTGLGFAFTGSGPKWLRALVQFQLGRALNLAQAITLCNKDDWAHVLLNTKADSSKMFIVPEGIRLCDFQPTLRQRSGPLRVLMVSRLLRDKGVLEFAEAAQILSAEFPEVEFQIVGGRDESNPTVVSMAEVQEWKSLGTPNWIGEVPKAEMPRILSECDCVVLPSYREGSPTSLMEASAMGIPVVATDVPGCRDIVENEVTGYLVPVRSAQKLAEAIGALLRAPELRTKYGNAGRTRAEQQYDEKRMFNDLLALYEGKI